MAKIIWRKRPSLLLDIFIDNASKEFGKSTALKWAEEVAAFENRVRQYPSSYAPESLLSGRMKLYRCCHIMHRRFKIIYFYDRTKDLITIMDIWNTRMNPTTLTKRIR